MENSSKDTPLHMGQIAVSALHEYFSPIRILLSFLENQLSRTAPSNNLTSTRFYSYKTESDATISNIAFSISREAICFNQGAYLQYSFVTAEKHKILKREFYSPNRDATLISSLVKEVADYVNSKFYECTSKNFEILSKFYTETNRSTPRICIKGSFRTNDKFKIVSVFRDSTAEYDSDSDMESNFGFMHVYKNGTYYLENDIPKATLEGRYFNSRLDSNLAKSLLKPRSRIKSDEWKKCWKEGGADQSSYYMSTLIIPMTLWNNDLEDEFKDLINLEDVDRTIFGFLCLDHTERDFFDDEFDVGIGYIIADILSMYVFARLIYLEISATFTESENWLHSRDSFQKYEALPKIWEELKKRESTRTLECGDINSPKASFNNRLFPIDDDLVDLVKGNSEKFS